FALDRLHFTPGIEKTIRKGFVLLTAFVITWLFVRVINAIIREFLLPYSQRSDNNLDAQLISLIQQVVKITIWSFGIIVGLNNAGFNVGALIAGLGIGGLALALASQDTVKNMFGGMILYLDKPFQVGDRVVIDRFDGIISEIGIRSTRMRTLEGLIVTIPNAHFSEKPIENYSQGPFFRVSCLINLEYNTAPQKVKEALEILRQIADENKEYFASNPLIFVEQFGVFAIEVKFLYYLKQEVNVFEFRNNVNMAILQRFYQAGISFAQPSQRN
ncbi:MAG: mechanosensitive ion channel family protein, partial [Chitinophagales bacterium]|nr:mechanosensitive ion channel family protein [Chitinophagales bacterium]